MILNLFRKIHQFFCILFFNPLELLRKWQNIPLYLYNIKKYIRSNTDPKFNFTWKDSFPILRDRFGEAGLAQGHYFWQDLWAAKKIFDNNVKSHVDVGSRLDGFIAHILPFCRVIYVDIRPLSTKINRFEFKQGSILEMPFDTNSIEYLSSLHVLEHIGLGRYGDPIDAAGYIKAAKELVRILAIGGTLLISTPIGRERLCFNAHRIFDPQTVVDIFSDLKLVEFSLIDDNGMKIISNACFEEARKCHCGCGLFVFEK